MAAAGKGRLEDAAALLTAGADPLLKSNDGSTAQDWAARFGHEDLAEFLGTHMQVCAPPSCCTLPQDILSALWLINPQAGSSLTDESLCPLFIIR